MEELRPFLYEYAHERIGRMLNSNPEYRDMSDEKLYQIASLLEEEFKSYPYEGNLKYSPKMPKHEAAVWIFEYVYARNMAKRAKEG